MSAPSVIPPSLKIVTSVMRRAEELDKDSADPESRIVAYYCRLYSVTKGSKIAGSDPEAGKFLINQMDILEKVKPTLTGDRKEDQQTCKNYAITVFNKADEEDRAGIADKTTAKIYYAAGSFFDILEYFGAVDGEIEEKRKYAKWKATEILNAIKEGRKPTPGGGGMDEAPGQGTPSADVPSAPKSDYSFDIPSAPVGGPVVPIPRPPFAASPTPMNQYQQNYQQAPPAQPQQQQQPGQYPGYSQPQQQNMSFQPPPTVASGGYNRPGYVAAAVPSTPPATNTDPRVKDVIEICAFAVAALKHNEINLARDRLTEALRRLG